MNAHLIRPNVFSGEPGLFAAFTTRGFAPPDRSEATRMVERLGASRGFTCLASVEQVHGSEVAVVSEPGRTPGSDGLVTNQRGLLLGTVAADCALVLLADVEAGVIGTCHAGWRGAVAGIVTHTIEQMESLGARGDRLLAFIGPSISLDAFEVGEEVASRFDPAFVDRQEDRPRPHVDLRGAVRQQLIDAGGHPDRIEVSEFCTVRDAGFHSYRGEGETAGRMFGLIGLL